MYTHSHKTGRAGAGIAGAVALAFLLSATPSVRAQQTIAIGPSGQVTAGATSVRQAVNRFADAYGTPIIQRGAIDGSAQATLALDATGSVQAREADIASLADAAGAEWHRMFFIAPATADKPVTTLAAAKNLTTDTGVISLQIRGLPLEAAARAFATASGSEVTLTGDAADQAGGTVTIPAANLTAARIIARMAAQTKTHWTVGYVLQPPPAGSARLARNKQNNSDQAIPVVGTDSANQADATTPNLTYSSTPYIGANLNGNPYAATVDSIPDGYDQNGNPYYIVPQGAASNSQPQSGYQTPYAMNAYAQNPYASNGYPGYYGYPGYDAGGFTTTSPTYYGYGYGAGTNPYAAGITQQYANPYPATIGGGLGVAPEFGTVFQSNGVGAGGGSETLTP